MTGPFIRPDVRAFLDMMAANPRPVFNDELMAMIRQMPADAMAGMDLPVGEMGEIRDVVMPGPGGHIPLRLYDPRASREPGPVVVFYHGGGFVVGSIDTHAGVAAEIARQLDLPVVSVEYRLAPEHKWPAAPDDAEALNALGYTLADRTDRRAEALELIQRAILLKPDEPAIIDSLGWIRYRMGDLDGSLEELRRAYAKQADPEIAAHLGEVLWVKGDRDEARRVWEQGRKKDAKNKALLETIRRLTT